MSSSFPRSLSSREQALLDPLLAQEFSGVEELRVQARSLRVKGIHNDLSTIVLLKVVDSEAPRAAVAHPVPVETKVRGSDPPQEVLLFVKDGVLDSIELIDYGSEERPELPSVDAVEAPTVNDASAEPKRPPGR
jgi:hypothetical protein